MQKTEATKPATQSAWDALAKSLALRSVDVSSMFGMPALKFGGKSFGGLFGNSLVLKLKGDAHAEALALKGASLFDPSGMGRPMKEWVVIPFTHQKSWSALAASSLKSLAISLEEKPKKKTKS